MAPDPLAEQIHAGDAALKAADWLAAKFHFEAVLKVEARPEAYDGLGIALWWLNEVPASHRQRVLAFNGLRRRGDVGRAAKIAAWLAREQVFLHGNTSAMNGWFARAERLLQDAAPGPEHGWFLIFRSSMLDPPADLAIAARQAIEIARTFHDVDLEMFALAFEGLAETGLGRVAGGLTRLDEAMTAVVSGEFENYAVASEVFCVMLSACEMTEDLERTRHWCEVALEFASEHNCPFLSAYCRTTYGGLLTASGRWSEADGVLQAAIRTFEAGHRALRSHAVIRLADLRVQQGRLEEAEVMLAGFEDHGEAVLPRARLHLAKGEPALARSLIEQTLGRLDDVGIAQAPLLLLLVDVLLDLSDVSAASDATERLVELANRARSDILGAQAELALGRVKARGGEPAAADHVKRALDQLRAYDQSLLAGRARLEMARLLQRDDWAGAVNWARGALASFERIGAARDADEATALLRVLGIRSRPKAALPTNLTARESEILLLLAGGLSNREIADRLFISPKTAEHHVGQILVKLGVRSRVEAAAIAVRDYSLELKPRKAADE